MIGNGGRWDCGGVDEDIGNGLAGIPRADQIHWRNCGRGIITNMWEAFVQSDHSPRSFGSGDYSK
jgi:hypothetical protein